MLSFKTSARTIVIWSSGSGESKPKPKPMPRSLATVSRDATMLPRIRDDDVRPYHLRLDHAFP